MRSSSFPISGMVHDYLTGARNVQKHVFCAGAAFIRRRVRAPSGAGLVFFVLFFVLHWVLPASASTTPRFLQEGTVLSHLAPGIYDTCAIASDAFNTGSLDRGRWEFINPLGDATLSVNASSVAIGVPAGTEHRLWDGTYTLARLMQTVPDQDFDLEVVFQSIPEATYAEQGLVIEGVKDGQPHYVRVELHGNGGRLRLFRAHLDGNFTTLSSSRSTLGPISSFTAPLSLRVARAGAQWTVAYTARGQPWTSGPSFEDAFAVTRLGVYAGNESGTNSPAHTAIIDAVINHGCAGEQDSTPTASSSPRATGTPSATTTPTALPTMTMTPSASDDTCAIASDAFDTGSLDRERWEFINPLGDATLSVNASSVAIGVPAGTEHRLWDGTYTLARLMQTVPDQDFDLEVVFQSIPEATYAEQGLVIEGVKDGQPHYVRVELHGNGGRLRLFRAHLDGNFTTLSSSRSTLGPISSFTAPLSLRVARAGAQWTVAYTARGQPWTSGPSFEDAFAVTRLGVYAGNESGTTSPAHTAIIDAVINHGCAGEQDSTPTASSSPRATGTPSATTTPATPIPSLTTTRTPSPIPTATPSLLPMISKLDYTYNQDTQSLAVQWSTDRRTTGRVEYGATTGYAFSQEDPTLSQEHRLSIAGLQTNMLYHFRVVVTDRTGNTSVSPSVEFTTYPPGAQDAIAVWYGQYQEFGVPGSPQAWVNILGRLANPANLNTRALTYRVNGGAEKRLHIGGPKKRLQDPGDFNIDLDYASLNEGLNTVTLKAVYLDDSEARETVVVNYRHGQTWPLPYSINWSKATSIQEVADVVDGLWGLNREQSTIRTLATGYDRLVAIGDVAWTDYEVEVPITIHERRTSSSLVGLVLRWQGHYHWSGSPPRWGWWPLGAMAFYGSSSDALELLGNDNQTLVRYPAELYHGSLAIDESGLVLQENVPYIFKAQVVSRGNDVSIYRLKVWQQGTSEPATWTLAGYGIAYQSAENPGELKQGSLLLVAHHTDASFGNVVVRPLGQDALSNEPRSFRLLYIPLVQK